MNDNQNRYKFTLLIMLISSFLFSQDIIDLYPKLDQTDNLIKHSAFSLVYSEEHEQAKWIYYILTKQNVINKTTDRTNDFRIDKDILTGSATLADYKGSGHDRGHLAPAADFDHDRKAMSESFYMSNMSPQLPGFNRGIWKKLEEQVRQWAIENKQIYIVTGGILTNDLQTIGENRVSIPKYYYKVIFDNLEPEIKMIGLILPNESSKEPLESYAVTVDVVEQKTNIDFFPALEDNLEKQLESQVDLKKWKN